MTNKRANGRSNPDAGPVLLSTGGVARLLRVAHGTAAKLIDSGQIRGYRIPGSGDRRVAMPDLVAFCEANGIPVPVGQPGSPPAVTRILFVSVDVSLADGVRRTLPCDLEVTHCPDWLSAGAFWQRDRPAAVVIDCRMGGDGSLAAAAWFARQEPAPRVLGMLPEDWPYCDRHGVSWTAQGFDAVTKHPVKPGWLREALAVEGDGHEVR
jgi:hypothetical protein